MRDGLQKRKNNRSCTGATGKRTAGHINSDGIRRKRDAGRADGRCYHG